MHHCRVVLPGVLKHHKKVVSKSIVCQKSGKKVLFQGNLCYHTVDERNRFQELKIGGILTGPKGPNNHFVTEAARAAG